MADIYMAEVRDFKKDPTKSGRVKVRIYNHNNDEQEVKDDELPWAMVVHPITSAATAKVGISPTGLRVGSRVIVTYFPDDHAKQYPVIIGSVARGDKPDGHTKSNGGVSKQSQDSQKNSGGKVGAAGPDNAASDGKTQ